MPRTSTQSATQQQVIADINAAIDSSTAKKRPYTQEEVQYLRDNFRSTSYVKIAAHLGRGVSAIQMKAASLGLKRTAKERGAIMCGWSRQPKVSTAPVRSESSHIQPKGTECAGAVL